MIVLVLALVGATSIIFYTFKNGISPMPSSRRAIKQMVAFTQEGNPKVIHELGCGWGGLARALAKGCPNAHVVAVENSWLPYIVSWLRLSGIENVTLLYGDFFDMDFTQCEWIVVYLYRGGMEKLKERVAHATVISNAFTIKGMSCLKEKDGVFLYCLK